jgi:hypothetical protein
MRPLLTQQRPRTQTSSWAWAGKEIYLLGPHYGPVDPVRLFSFDDLAMIPGEQKPAAVVSSENPSLHYPLSPFSSLRRAKASDDHGHQAKQRARGRDDGGDGDQMATPWFPSSTHAPIDGWTCRL